MSTFNPSHHFSKKWLSMPIVARQAFHQELDDIIALLKGDIPAQHFEFQYKNFNEDIVKLLHTYDEKISDEQPNDEKPNPPNSDILPMMSSSDIQKLEQQLHKKLSNRIDDTLSEQMAQLSEELQGWLRDAIKQELSVHLSLKETP